MKAIGCLPSTNYIWCNLLPIKASMFCLLLMLPFTNTKLLDRGKKKKKCFLPLKDFEKHGAYISKFGCVYSVRLLITWIQ